MNKPEIIEQLAVRLAITASESERLLNGFVRLIYDRLKEGDTVKISGFGQFSVSHREAREGVDPRTGQRITIPKLNTPKFKAGEAFKAAVKLR